MARSVILGGGQAAAQLAISLRQAAAELEITIISDEAHLPYMRPPLSKGLLKGETTAADLPFRDAVFYAEDGIDLRLSTRAVALDLPTRQVTLSDGVTLDFDTLTFATGTRPRMLTCPGSDLGGIHSLRTLDHALAIAEHLGSARRVAVVGGGFIGLEFASVAAKAGKDVTVIEAGERLMGRAVSPEMSKIFLDLHRANGVEVRLEAGVTGFSGVGGQVAAVQITDGTEIAADLVVVGVGVHANDELARDAGLTCDAGILVDERLQTSAPGVYAIGDCARFPTPRSATPVRLESVQNAVDQAKYLGASCFAPQGPYAAVPWFWSEQFNAKLQIAGLLSAWDDCRWIGDPPGASFSIEFYAAGKLVAVESVNDPRTHLRARKAL